MTAERGVPLAIPASIFSVSFGLAGLSGCWRLGAQFLGAPAAICTVLTVLTLMVWAVLLVAFLRRLASDRTSLHTELTHPVTAPFLALIPVTLLVLVPEMVTWMPAASRWITWLSIAAAVSLGPG